MQIKKVLYLEKRFYIMEKWQREQLDEAIKERGTKFLNDILSCKTFTMNYPLLIDHILREANLYRSYIIALENGQDIEKQDIRDVEIFWN